MSDAVGPGDLVLCVNAAPNHVTGRPVPLQAGENYRVFAVMEFACPCGRSDALLDVGVDFAWCQTRSFPPAAKAKGPGEAATGFCAERKRDDRLAGRLPSFRTPAAPVR